MPSTYDVAIDAVYAAAADPDQWSAALEKVADHVGGSGGMLVYNDLGGDTGFITTGRLREDLGRLYVTEYIRNPVTQAMLEQPLDVPIPASHLVGTGRLRHSALYADIIAPQHQVDLVCVAQSSLSRRGATGGVAITVNEQQSDKLGLLVSRLARLAPHLARATDLSSAIVPARERLGPMATLLGAMSNAALLLDRKARLLCANAAAHRILEENDGLCIGVGGLLTASVAEARLRVSETIAEAIRDATAQLYSVRPAKRVARPSGRADYLLILVPLPASALALRAIVQDEAVLLVQISDPVTSRTVSALQLEGAFDLTAAEARVAVLVSSGKSVPETATVLRVAPNTVKTHLARCFDKTGVRSQVALARLVAGIPAPGGVEIPDGVSGKLQNDNFSRLPRSGDAASN